MIDREKAMNKTFLKTDYEFYFELLEDEYKALELAIANCLLRYNSAITFSTIKENIQEFGILQESRNQGKYLVDSDKWNHMIDNVLKKSILFEHSEELITVNGNTAHGVSPKIEKITQVLKLIKSTFMKTFVTHFKNKEKKDLFEDLTKLFLEKDEEFLSFKSIYSEYSTESFELLSYVLESFFMIVYDTKSNVGRNQMTFIRLKFSLDSEAQTFGEGLFLRDEHESKKRKKVDVEQPKPVNKEYLEVLLEYSLDGTELKETLIIPSKTKYVLAKRFTLPKKVEDEVMNFEEKVLEEVQVPETNINDLLSELNTYLTETSTNELNNAFRTIDEENFRLYREILNLSNK